MKISILYSCTEKYFPYLKLSLNSIPVFSSLEIVVVVNQGLKKRCKSLLKGQLLPGLKIVETPVSMSNMMKAFCLNFAAKNAEGDYLLISDADLLYPPCFWSLLLNALPIDKKTVLHFFVGRLNHKITQEIMAGKISWPDIYQKYEGRMIFYPPRSLLKRALLRISRALSRLANYRVRFYNSQLIYDEIYGSINPCIYHKEFFFDLGGYDEKFIGWGGEDDDLENRTIRAGGINKRIPIIIAHLWHPRIMDFPNYISGSSVYGSKKLS